MAGGIRRPLFRLTSILIVFCSMFLSACGSWMVVSEPTSSKKLYGESSAGMSGGSTLSTSKDYSFSHGLGANAAGGTLHTEGSDSQTDINYSITNR